MGYIIALVIAALIGNFLIRHFVAAADKSTPDVDQPQPEHAKRADNPPNTEEILRAWGKLGAEHQASELVASLHPSFAQLLRKYESVGPDEYLRVIDRSLAVKPFDENTDFVQIGAWGDGSEVIARRDATDARVYLADIEDAMPDKPVVLAESTDAYLAKAWQYHRDSLNEA